MGGQPSQEQEPAGGEVDDVVVGLEPAGSPQETTEAPAAAPPTAENDDITNINANANANASNTPPSPRESPSSPGKGGAALEAPASPSTDTNASDTAAAAGPAVGASDNSDIPGVNRDIPGGRDNDGHNDASISSGKNAEHVVAGAGADPDAELGGAGEGGEGGPPAASAGEGSGAGEPNETPGVSDEPVAVLPSGQAVEDVEAEVVEEAIADVGGIPEPGVGVDASTRASLIDDTSPPGHDASGAESVLSPETGALAGTKPAGLFLPHDCSASSGTSPGPGLVGPSPAGGNPDGFYDVGTEGERDAQGVAEDGVLATPSAEVPDPARPAEALADSAGEGVAPEDTREEEESADSGASIRGGESGSASRDPGGAADEDGDGDAAAAATAEAEVGAQEDGAYVTATNSSLGESEENGAYETMGNSDACDGDPAREVVTPSCAAATVPAADPGRTAGEALGLVARSQNLLNAVVSLEACRAFREGRTFHVKVSADTPRYVWSPPSPLPPPVGEGGGSPRGGAWGRGMGGAKGRAGSRVVPLRVSHITWDRADEDLGDDFALNLPLDLEKLTFSFAFNSPVDGVEVDWPPGMTALHFGMAFNPRPAGAAAAAGTTRSRPLPAPSPSSSDKGSEAGWPRFLPPTLEEVVFGGHFNQPVEGVKWPPGLKRLVFGANFKQKVEVADWPDSLEEITFSTYFNQPIEGMKKWPKSLRKLVFGVGFNQPIEKCRFPGSLEEIVFGTHFNKPVADTDWPASLRSVTFGDRFNKPVVSSSWPPSLTYLTFGKEFDQPLVLPSPPPAQEHGRSGGGGGGSRWPPSGLELVVVGSKFSGDAEEPSGEGGVEPLGDGGSRGRSRGRGGGGHQGFTVRRRVSVRRAKRRGSRLAGAGAARAGEQPEGGGAASTATSEAVPSPPKTMSPLAVQWRKRHSKAPRG